MRERPTTSSIPDAPGSYQFLDRDGRVLYVGKAKSLRARLSSYLGDPDRLSARTADMVGLADHVEWIQVSSEIEALLLEHNLIRQFRPRYNIALVDDESYPWLALTMKDEWPRALVTRRRNITGARYFGPFPQRFALRETLDLALNSFGVRSCSKGVFDRAKRNGRPCLLFDIDRCSGPCVGAVSKDEYSALLADFSDVFNGKCVDVTSRLRREMESASSNLDFELAGRRRDQLKSLSIVGERQHVINPNGEDLDAIALAEDDLAGVVCVLRVRGGVLIGRRSLVIDKVEDASGSELMGKVLNQIYGSDEPAPRTVLVDTLPSELSECLGLLEQTRGGPVDLRAPKRGGKAALISTATTNAQEELSRLRLRRTSDHASRTRALYALGEALEMKQPPLRIECYDMSHLQGTDYVGSMVVLEDGVPAKGEYRKFTIKDVDGNDDYAAMEEVLTRRLTALLASRKSTIDSRSGKTESTAGAVQRHADHGSKSSKFSYPPQLILLDGGKGQLGVGVRVLAELGLTDEIAIASLAKSFEEVFVPGQSDPITIQRGNEALYILQRARDEAHRFAITTHRKKRGKRMTRGALDSVSGLGAKRRARLLRELGGVSGVRAASLEALTALPWLPNNIADGIFSSLHPEAH